MFIRLMVALTVWLSMGPGPWRPYGWLFRFVPGFNGMRVPARLASIVILALAVLAGAGFARLVDRCLRLSAAGFARLFDRFSRRWAAVAAIAFGALIVLEGQHRVRVREVPGWREHNWDRVAYTWLRNSPPGAVLELEITGMNYFQTTTTLFQLH